MRDTAAVSSFFVLTGLRATPPAKLISTLGSPASNPRKTAKSHPAGMVP